MEGEATETGYAADMQSTNFALSMAQAMSRESPGSDGWWPCGTPPCREGASRDDFCTHSCDIELADRYRSRRDNIERHFDLIHCFTDPTKAESGFPLTTGRVLKSCIYDQV